MRRKLKIIEQQEIILNYHYNYNKNYNVTITRTYNYNNYNYNKKLYDVSHSSLIVMGTAVLSNINLFPSVKFSDIISSMQMLSSQTSLSNID